MSEILTPKVLILGGGPGGYVAAIRCGQLGLDTVLVEAGRLGGTCLIRGCIPSKAIIHVAGQYEEMTKAASAPVHGVSLASAPRIDLAETVRWKDGIVDRLNQGVAGLLARAKVKVISGWGTFSDAKTCEVRTEDGLVTIRPEHVILATGSSPINLPALGPGDKVISSTEALCLSSVPESLVIVGAGYIGLELGGAFAKLGSKVTVVEMADRILPSYDAKLVAPVQKAMEALGVTFLFNSEAVEENAKGLMVKPDGGRKRTLPADKILVTVGRRPNTQDWGLENIAIKTNGRFVDIDDQCATSSRNVWAIGDLVGEPMLEHKAATQGEMVAEIIAGRRRRFDFGAIPAVCFTDPEIVTVGAGPEEPDTIHGVFPFFANGRALTMAAGEEQGFVRVIASKASHRILGVQAVGSHVSELSVVFTHAIEMGAVLEDVAGIIHAHPTLGEAFHEAALKALGHAIHI
ncbi:dihydrolipoyl dehydrogenase [Henriciella sp.]|uniref:dihydrolipoyl dehydrogenase n=1 Tax=Henriciella sp. TaxID=1968823 RepID=UPI0026220572|nr:dihydrolipoyl dehydrogenase [Henriciella sp.]